MVEVILDGVPPVAGDEHDFMQKFAPATQDGEPVPIANCSTSYCAAPKPITPSLPARDQSRAGIFGRRLTYEKLTGEGKRPA
jgi:hypothetical protein